MSPRSGFATKAHGKNEKIVTSALPPRRFRGDRFQASIPQPSPISFLPSIENISEVYRLSHYSSRRFLAPTFSYSVYAANESQACFVRGVLDWLEGLPLQLPPLLFPATLSPLWVCTVFPIC